ncbi:MAG TPA: hypothetical protein VG984_01200 [Candidatus Paceibacterota bacterium]|nr:hypothetical protein [Candidatus Paceibacterota bacterium]
MSAPEFGVITYEVPNRGLVVVYLDQTTWPCKVDDVGFVPHWAVVPDPNQPRDKEDFDPDSLRELGENIKINGQSEPMKVRLLTQEEKEGKYRLEDGRCPEYMLVSGGRRWESTSARFADVPVLKILVAQYADEDEQFLDAYVVNEDREDLGPRSIARALKRLLERNCGGNVAELVRKTGKSRGYIDTYLPINNLIPEAWKFLNRKLPDKERMGVALASALGQLTPEKQRKYIEPIMSGVGGRSMVQRIRWLTDQLVRDYAAEGTQMERPEERSEHVYRRFERLIDAPRANAAILMGASDQLFADAFKQLDAQECANLLRQYEAMEDMVRRVRERFSDVTINKKSFLERNKDVLAGWRTVDYYNQGKVSQLIKNSLVSPEKFEHLKRLGWLKWQRDGSPDPDVGATTAAAPEAEVEGAKPPDKVNGTVTVTFYYWDGGRMEKLAQDQPVNAVRYRALRSNNKLFWQRKKLQPSSAEEAFCKEHQLVF